MLFWGAAEDLFLGYWNSGGSDVVLRNNEGGVLGGGRADGSSGVWRVGDVTVSQAVANNAINAAQEQKLSTFGTPNQPSTINRRRPDNSCRPFHTPSLGLPRAR